MAMAMKMLSVLGGSREVEAPRCSHTSHTVLIFLAAQLFLTLSHIQIPYVLQAAQRLLPLSLR